MENNTNPSLDNIFNLGLDVNTMGYLRTAATWARIVALLAFISAGLGLLVAFFEPGDTAGKAGGVIGAIISGAISVIINLYLYRFATQVTAGLSSMNQDSVTTGINNLRVYFKILGIILIIVLGLVVLGVFFGMLFFGLGSAMR